jgi:chemotaxis protein histidine kinase CheA
MADGNIQFITPPNRLKAKLGNRVAGFDASAIARAEEALRNMSSQFGDWLNDEIAKLESTHKAAIAPGADSEAMEAFYRSAHDLKGLGTTYGFPIISQFAASLCKLIDSPDARARASHQLLTAHVQAMVASVRQNIKESTHPLGAALLRELSEQVAKFASAD